MSIAIAAIIPLLKLHWLKRLAMISAVTGGAISLVWAGYEYGSKQKDAMRMELLARAVQSKSGRAVQDTKSAEELQSLRDENDKLKSYIDQSKLEAHRDSDFTAKPPINKKKNIRNTVNTKDDPMEDGWYLNNIKTTYNEMLPSAIIKDKKAESPIALEPTWVDSGASVQAISGQVIIRVYHAGQWKTPCNYGEASVLIDVPYKESIQACLSPGLRKTFDFNGKNFFLSLLQARSREEKSRNPFSETDIMNTIYEYKVSVVMAQ